MTFLNKGRKVDLQVISEELNLAVQPELKVVDLKYLITKSEAYDPEFTDGLLDTIVA